MSRHVAIVINGVLRDPINRQPNEDGKGLYHALANNFRLTLLADDDIDLTDHWLMVEGFQRHTNVSFRHHKTRVQQILHMRASGPLDLVVTAEAELAPDLYKIGQPTMIYLNPRQYTRLPTRPEWDDLVARIDEDRERAALTLQEVEEI